MGWSLPRTLIQCSSNLTTRPSDGLERATRCLSPVIRLDPFGSSPIGWPGTCAARLRSFSQVPSRFVFCLALRLRRGLRGTRHRRTPTCCPPALQRGRSSDDSLVHMIHFRDQPMRPSADLRHGFFVPCCTAKRSRLEYGGALVLTTIPTITLPNYCPWRSLLDGNPVGEEGGSIRRHRSKPEFF